MREPVRGTCEHLARTAAVIVDWLYLYSPPAADARAMGARGILARATANDKQDTEDVSRKLHNACMLLTAPADEVSHFLRVCRRFLTLLIYDYYRYDKHGRTLLITAAALGHVKSVIDLLLAGIDTGHKDFSDNTALLCAAGAGRHVVVQLLLTVGVRNAEPADDLASRLSTLKKFDRQATRLGGLTALSAASRNGHESVVRLLLADPDVNPNHQDGLSRTPLTWASTRGHVAAVQALLSHEGVDADHRDWNGDTPLASAAKNGHVDVVELLLAHARVDRNSTNSEWKTPLSLAAQMWKVEVVRRLLAAGADPTMKDDRGFSPVDLAKGGDDRVRRGLDGLENQPAMIKLLNGAIAAREPKESALLRYSIHFFRRHSCCSSILVGIFPSAQESCLAGVSGAGSSLVKRATAGLWALAERGEVMHNAGRNPKSHDRVERDAAQNRLR
ncbi:ankyrin repeat protein [Beauveria bassiana ARSEF 2860]|uniref:Ankyrin repeat protein n=1 Tax=Beauveria bassiana (strain ARSEF 2860) TaxID=655819 RepID=J4VU11_BEAB2|nr:ankyrin repeat protein [Beauveria bassiana ARSEF 2860]EJP62020.1 ankyrin repeat protein [Beauveria bassiana ARSEF 2860]